MGKKEVKTVFENVNVDLESIQDVMQSIKEYDCIVTTDFALYGDEKSEEAIEFTISLSFPNNPEKHKESHTICWLPLEGIFEVFDFNKVKLPFSLKKYCQ